MASTADVVSTAAETHDLESRSGRPSPRSAAIRHYGTAVAFVLPALILTLLLRPLFPYPFFFLFFPAVMASAWFGGLGVGLFAVLLSTVSVAFFLVPPIYSLAVNRMDASYFLAFAISALAATWISSFRTRRERVLVEVQNQLEAGVAQRTAELQESRARLQYNERQIRLLTDVIPRQFLGAAANGLNDPPAAASSQEVLAELVKFCTSLAKCDACFVYVLEDDELVLRASRDVRSDVVGRIKLKVGQGITGWVAQHRQPVVIARGAFKDPRFQTFNELPEDKVEAFLSVPLLSRGKVVGVINLQHRAPYEYGESEIRLISALGFFVGAEIDLARMETENLRLYGRLETRKIVERAKGILQRELQISEEDAYQMLQRESRQRRKSMKQIAEAVLLNEDIKTIKDRPDGT